MRDGGGESQCPGGFICGKEGYCHGRDGGVAWACDHDGDCDLGWRCGLNGLCVDPSEEVLRQKPHYAHASGAQRINPLLIAEMPEYVAGWADLTGKAMAFLMKDGGLVHVSTADAGWRVRRIGVKDVQEVAGLGVFRSAAFLLRRAGGQKKAVLEILAELPNGGTRQNSVDVGFAGNEQLRLWAGPLPMLFLFGASEPDAGADHYAVLLPADMGVTVVGPMNIDVRGEALLDAVEVEGGCILAATTRGLLLATPDGGFEFSNLCFPVAHASCGNQPPSTPRTVKALFASGPLWAALLEQPSKQQEVIMLQSGNPAPAGAAEQEICGHRHAVVLGPCGACEPDEIVAIRPLSGGSEARAEVRCRSKDGSERLEVLSALTLGDCRASMPSPSEVSPGLRTGAVRVAVANNDRLAAVGAAGQLWLGYNHHQSRPLTLDRLPAAVVALSDGGYGVFDEEGVALPHPDIGLPMAINLSAAASAVVAAVRHRPGWGGSTMEQWWISRRSG